MEKNINLHTKALFEFIFYAPPEQQKKYGNGYETFSEEWYSENEGDSFFRGILFKDNRVYTINIEIFCKDKDYEPQYLEITDTFNELLKTYNIYNLCILISTVLRKKYYKDCSLAHKLKPRVKNDSQTLLPKFRYEIEKHHSRHRKFYFDREDRSLGTWSEIIHSALREVVSLESYAINSGVRRPDLFFKYNREEPTLYSRQNRLQYSDPVQRRPRRASLGFKFGNR